MLGLIQVQSLRELDFFLKPGFDFFFPENHLYQHKKQSISQTHPFIFISYPIPPFYLKLPQKYLC